ncbi:hypothetical protein ACJRO7_023850 [Eucalyptus globulus]|uniref:Disease resistance protein winged helix domain-containing protein n=1 Tax=Eucalyptus globulus TaxID=34317 RepID=A0ABD3K4E1_EUCGL
MQQKWFVVVLDDVWRMRDWEQIVNLIQNGFQCNVGMSCVKNRKYVHQLNRLPLEKALSLFWKKACRSCDGICPIELQDWSEKIIKKSGNLLSRKWQSPYEWKKFHDSLGDNLPVMRRILLPSYEDLPSDLRSCFLYFSISPEDYSIQWQILIRLWIAEGFVKEARNTSLEEVAENYLNKLVQRNLVHVTARDIDGRVRSCCVLNLVHDFIIARAAEENFVVSASERSSLSRGRIQRLSARTEISINVELSETLGHVQSAFMFGRGKFSNLQFFRLKILDMRGAPLEDFPKNIFKLVLLKYLSLRETNIKTFPKGVEMLSGRGELSDIQKLSLMKATTELIQKLDGMIHLRKLGLKMEHLSALDLRAKSGDYPELDYIQDKPRFEFLRHLYLKGQLQKLPRWVSTLQSLIKVGLKWSRLNINPLQALQDLSNLMELHMFEMNTFKKLKIFRIEQFSELSMVAVQVGAMLALEKLTFGNIVMLTGLKELLLYDMNREFINQLQKHSEDQPGGFT